LIIFLVNSVSESNRTTPAAHSTDGIYCSCGFHLPFVVFFAFSNRIVVPNPVTTFYFAVKSEILGEIIGNNDTEWSWTHILFRHEYISKERYIEIINSLNGIRCDNG
jgi:hypothetical protein